MDTINGEKRLSFDEDAANYDKWRPRYTKELFEDVIRTAGIGDGKRRNTGALVEIAHFPEKQTAVCIRTFKKSMKNTGRAAVNQRQIRPRDIRKSGIRSVPMDLRS